MTQTTPTCLWNDSAAIEELTYSIEHGAVGATCNPSIAVTVLKQELPIWKPRISELAKHFPDGDRRRNRLDDRRRNVGERRQAAQAHLRSRKRPQRPPFHPDRSPQLSQLRRHVDPGHPLQPAGSEHDRQDRRHPRRASSPSKKPPIAASASTRPSASPCRSQSPSPRPSSAASSAAKPKASISRPWARSAPSWWAASTTGSRFCSTRTTYPSIPAIWSGQASQSSRRPTRFSANVAIGCGFSPRPSATTCTGASSSAATLSSLRPAPGKSATTTATSKSSTASIRPSTRRSSTRCSANFLTSNVPTPRTVYRTKSSTPSDRHAERCASSSTACAEIELDSFAIHPSQPRQGIGTTDKTR